MKPLVTFALLALFAGASTGCVNVAVLAAVPDGADGESRDADEGRDEMEPRPDVESHDAKDDHDGEHQDALDPHDDDHFGTDR